MHCQIIKVICELGEEERTEVALKRYLKAARLNPGFVHGSYFTAEAAPDGEAPPGFGITDRQHTYFIYVAFRSPREMLRHVELYHSGEESLLPSPHDYILGGFEEDDSIEVDDRYSGQE